MPARRYETDEEAAAAVAAALHELPETFIQCRDVRHAWAVSEDFYVHATGEHKTIQEVRRELVCMRCNTGRVEIYHPTRYMGLEKVKQFYVYAEGYQLKRVPRGVKPQQILHAEQYRRAMERLATQTKKGAMPRAKTRG